MSHRSNKLTKCFVLILNALLLPLVQTQTVAAAVEEESNAPLSALLQTPEAADADHALESTRTFGCVPLLRIFNLELKTPLRAGESVGLTGDHAKLGQWQVEKSLKMYRLGTSGRKFLLTVPVCAKERFHYRYFVYYTDERGHKRIRRWEGQQHARMLERYDIYRQLGTDVFGEINGGAMSQSEVEKGWLRHEQLVEFKFVWPQHMQFSSNLGFLADEQLLLRFIVRRQKPKVNTKKYAEDIEVEYARSIYNRSQFRRQSEKGVAYSAGDIVVFHITEPLKAKNAYQLIISTMLDERIGEVLIQPMNLRASHGVLKLMIVSPDNGYRIGLLTLPYLVVRPVKNAELFNFRSSFKQFWPVNWPTMDVGYRGMGTSFQRKGSVPPQYQNTISSFLQAHQLHGDMVTFEVLLTKDYVPVLWHDFGFLTAALGRKVETEEDLSYVLIKDLSYMQLKRSRVFVRRHTHIKEYTNLNAKDAVHPKRIFPTLSATLKSLPKSLGLIIDIKWAQPPVDVIVNEKQQAFDKNRYVNMIFDISAKHGCGRALIFASFDPDICTLMSRKQNVFPVVFLTLGNAHRGFSDLRTQKFLNAVNFAQSENLLGTAPYIRDVSKDSQHLHLGLDLMQVVFVWGGALNNAGVVRMFKNLAVTGVIYDHLDLHGPKANEKRMSFFNATELSEIFDRQCVAAGNLTKLTNATTALNMSITIGNIKIDIFNANIID